MTAQDDIAISVQGVSKTFKLPHEKNSSIKSALINFARHKKGYEKQHVLKNISFDIKKGEFFGIVGRNGSGKSTLLKLLAGIYTPDKGNIQVNGKLTPFIELGVGFNPELTGRENVFLNGALLGFSRKEMLAMYDDIVAFAELERFMDQKLKNYSSGMQVRLAFSIAIRAQSDILVLDEVLAVGDESFQRKCTEYFAGLKERSQTVILVTHDMSNVEKFCDRVLVVDMGKQLGLFETFEAQKLYAQLNRQDAGNEKTAAIQRRWGTHKAMFDSITLADQKDKQALLTEGLGLQFNIKIKSATGKKTPVVIGLGIHDESGTYISGPNSDGLPLFTNQRMISYQVDRNPLNPGRYRVEAALFSDDLKEEYDHILDVLQFEVVSGGRTGKKYGKIELFGEWSKQ